MSFNDTVWNHAFRGESEALLNALSEAPFLLNALDENGQTVLLTACTFGHTETVEMLLSKNPDINVCDHQGNSPLHLLCMEGHENLVKTFLSRPEVNTQPVNKMGQSILHKACIGTKYQWKQNCFHIVLSGGGPGRAREPTRWTPGGKLGQTRSRGLLVGPGLTCF